MKQGTSNLFYLLGLVLLFYGIKASHLLDVVVASASTADGPRDGMMLIGFGVLSLVVGLMGTILRGR